MRRHFSTSRDVVCDVLFGRGSSGMSSFGMDSAARERLFDRFELAASAAWLGMDFAWMEAHTPSALALAALTCVTSIGAVLAAEPRFTPRAVAGAMAAWAVMNSFWMLSDLDLYDGLWLGRLCFALGIALLCAVLAVDRSTSELFRELARRFRRLRLTNRPK